MPRETPPDTATIPEIVTEVTPKSVFEVMTRAVFQAGVSWAQIARHWHAYERAFAGFDPTRVAVFGPSDVERVMAESGVLRMPRKINATIVNAQALLEIHERFGDFHAYAATFPTYAARAKDIKRRFAFMGDMNVWYLLFRIGEPVPRFETWVTTIPGDHPRMREMVERARATSRSSEVESAGE